MAICVLLTHVCKIWAKSDKNWNFFLKWPSHKIFDLQRLERSLNQGQMWSAYVIVSRFRNIFYSIHTKLYLEYLLGSILFSNEICYSEWYLLVKTPLPSNVSDRYHCITKCSMCQTGTTILLNGLCVFISNPAPWYWYIIFPFLLSGARGDAKDQCSPSPMSEMAKSLSSMHYEVFNVNMVYKLKTNKEIQLGRLLCYYNVKYFCGLL
jgi:hypothetical protein